MVLDDIEVSSRVDSPDNLLNRLRAITKPAKSVNNLVPSLPPSADELIEDLDRKLHTSTIKTKAEAIMLAAMDTLGNNLDAVDKPEKLARIVESMSKVVEAHTPKKQEGPQIGQVIIYSPQQREEVEYPVIDIRKIEEATV